jgi:hypothetical protein
MTWRVRDEPKTERRSIAMSRREVRYIQRLADLHGMTWAEYVRMRATSDPIERIS